MGKNKKKEKLKKQEKQPLVWESLMPLRKECVTLLANHSNILNVLASTFKNTIDSDQELKNTVIGSFKSLSDVSKDIRAITERHVTYGEPDENGRTKIVDYKRGKIEGYDDDCMMEFMEIMNDYSFQVDHINNLFSTCYLDILSKIQATPDSINDQDLTNYLEQLNTLIDPALSVSPIVTNMLQSVLSKKGMNPNKMMKDAQQAVEKLKKQHKKGVTETFVDKDVKDILNSGVAKQELSETAKTQDDECGASSVAKGSENGQPEQRESSTPTEQ